MSSVESALERHGISNPRLDIAEGDSVHTVMYYPEKDMDRDTASALSEELSSDMGRMVRVVRSGWGIVFEIPKDKALRRERLFDDEIEKTDFDERMCLPLFLGYDTCGNPLIMDLVQAPHILISGAVRQGEGTLQKTMIESLLRTKKPGDVQFLIADGKMVEFSEYRKLDRSFFFGNGILWSPDEVIRHLDLLGNEIDKRYEVLSKSRCRNIEEYTKGHSDMPYIVVIVSEYADFFGRDTNERNRFLHPLIKLAQMGRPVGIHCIISTQRPSTEFLSGFIKANFPTRIATRCSSKVESMTILDMEGAEKLIGRGDMILSHNAELTRFQGLFHGTEGSVRTIMSANDRLDSPSPLGDCQEVAVREKTSPLYDDVRSAARLFVENGFASVSFLQRTMGWGYVKASRVMDQLAAIDIIKPAAGAGTWEVIPKNMEELAQMMGNGDDS